MVKQYRLELDDELYEKLREIAEKENKSIKDVIIESINAYLFGEKGEKPQEDVEKDYPELKVIVALYNGKCKECGEDIKRGDLIAWAKGYGAICLKCYYKKIPDKGLVKKYVKVKELELVSKKLRKAVNELSEKYITLRDSIRYYEVMEEIRKVINNIYVTFGNNEQHRELITKLEKLYTKLERMNKLIEYIAEMQFSKKRPVRRKRSEEEEEIEI